MPAPRLYNDRTAAGNQKGGQKNCYFFVPAENLNLATTKDDVTVERTDGGQSIVVKKADVVPGRTYPQVLAMKTKEVRKRPGHGDTEEVTVTVTDPDTGDEAETDVEVVYFDDPTRSKKKKAVKKKAAKKKAR